MGNTTCMTEYLYWDHPQDAQIQIYKKNDKEGCAITQREFKGK